MPLRRTTPDYDGVMVFAETETGNFRFSIGLTETAGTVTTRSAGYIFASWLLIGMCLWQMLSAGTNHING